MKMLFRIAAQTNFQSLLPAVCEQWSAEALLKLNVDFWNF